MFAAKTWKAPDARVLSNRGYAIRKDELTPAETRALQKALLMKPNVPAEFSAGIEPFPIYYESASRWYVPRFWGVNNCGVPDGDARSDGLPLRKELHFAKTLRAEQIPIVTAFLNAAGEGFLDEANGLICVPCGIGKTFMGIWLALKKGKRFLIAVHQEFLANQWKKELEAAVPGIRVGILQGSKAQIGEEFDCCICMIQTVVSRNWPADTFAGFGFTIFDECHHLGAEHFSRALLSIQTKHMLGLSATPDRADGLDTVFQSYIGPVRYQIRVREPDPSVVVRVIRYDNADEAYATVPTDARGEPSRPKLGTQLAGFLPRTVTLTNELVPALEEGRKLLILSDRKEQLREFERQFVARGFTSVGYYIGGMTEAAREESAKKQIILATFMLASEGMNIRDLNTVALATPKSSIEQSVGRIFRLKKEERVFAPLIFDLSDSHACLAGQARKRMKFFVQCGYQITVKNVGETDYRVLRRSAAPVASSGSGVGVRDGSESDSDSDDDESDDGGEGDDPFAAKETKPVAKSLFRVRR